MNKTAVLFISIPFAVMTHTLRTLKPEVNPNSDVAKCNQQQEMVLFYFHLICMLPLFYVARPFTIAKPA